MNGGALMVETAYKEERKWELHDGKIVYMAPSASEKHMTAAGNIFNIFKNALKLRKCRVYYEFDVHFSSKDMFKPDISVVCRKDIIKQGGIYGAPDLVVEVLSPSTANHDRAYKKNTYEKHGVKEYWIVNPQSRDIEVYLLKNGRFELDNVYAVIPDYELEKMSEENKKCIITKFKTSLFDDLVITLDEVFEDLLED
jgi:Uma2 family endonuclease